MHSNVRSGCAGFGIERKNVKLTTQALDTYYKKSYEYTPSNNAICSL